MATLPEHSRSINRSGERWNGEVVPAGCDLTFFEGAAADGCDLGEKVYICMNDKPKTDFYETNFDDARSGAGGGDRGYCVRR